MIARLAAVAALLIALPASSGTISGGSASGGSLGGPAAEPPPDSFVTLEDSTFGTSASGRNNITGRVPKLHPFDWPDPSTWVADTTFAASSCSTDNTTINAIRDYYEDTIPSFRQLILPNCDIMIQGSNGPQWITFASGSTNKTDYVEFVGQPNTSFVGEPIGGLLDETNPDYVRTAPDHVMIQFGEESTDVTEVASCDWTGGYAMHNQILQLGCAISTSSATAWGVGDLVWIQTNKFPGGHTTPTTHRISRRLICVNGAVEGPSDRTGDPTECADVTGDNTIKIDRPLSMDYSDGAYSHPAYPSGTENWVLTGRRVRQMERVGAARGGAGTETNNFAEYVGFRNIKAFREKAYFFNSGASFIQWGQVADFWVKDSDHDQMGNHWYSVKGSASRGLFQGNRYKAPTYRAACVGSIISFGDNGSGAIRVTMRMDTDLTDCEVPSGSFSAWDALDSLLYFGDTVSEPSLRGKFRRRQAISNDTVNNIVVMDLPGTSSSGIATAGGGLVSFHNNWNVGSHFVNGLANNVHIIGEYFDGSRMGPLLQSGTSENVLAWNWMEHTPDENCSRFGFFHGNSVAPGNMFIGNRVDCRIVPYATSNRTDDGEGINVVWAKNRLVDTGPETGPDGIGNYTNLRGYFDMTEQTNQNGSQNRDFTFVGNVMERIRTGPSGIDWLDNDGDSGAGSGGDENAPPYMLYGATLLLNRCYGSGCDLDAALDNAPNPTTWAPDITGDVTFPEPDEGTGVPPEWSGVNMFTDLYYRESDLVNGVPPWWCTNSTMQYGEIGATYDDLNETETVSPARDRWDGTCTLP